MEKRKKHRKLIATAPNQEHESKDHLSKEEQNQPDETLAAKHTKNGSTSQNVSSLNDRYSNILRWPYTTQKVSEQSSLNITSLTPPNLASRSHQVGQLQPNSPYHPVQQGQPVVQLAPSTSSFWPTERPCYQFPAATVPATFQPFISMTAIGSNWQPSPMMGTTSPKSQPQVPNICYHSVPYPGYPGPWEPSSWWTHGQQTQPSFNYTFPGSDACFSSEPSLMTNCSGTFGESSQRGIIQPMAKLSQKHQQLWEAQVESMENVQLWRIIGQLQSEIADYKSRLVKLEAKVASLKPSVDEPFAQVVRTRLSGAASKKGRPKSQRSVGLANASASHDESHPQARGLKPAGNKDQPEPRALVYENVVLNKVGEIAQSISSTRKNNSVGLGINGSNLPTAAFHNNQAQQESPGIKICGMTIDSFEMKATADKVHHSKSSQRAKQNTGASAMHMGWTNSESETLTLPANFVTEGPRRNIYNQSLYENVYLMREAGKLIPGWSFVNEEDVSDEHEDAIMVSAKDEKEEDMGDNVSSGSEEIAQIKDDSAAASNPEDLTQCKNW